MEDQTTLNKVLVVVESLKEDVGALKADVGVLKEDVGALKQDVTVLKEDQRQLREVVEFIKDNAVTKQEFEERLDERLTEFKSEIISHIDGFTKLHETLDQELVFLRHKYDRLEERVERVEQKVGLAVTA